MEKVTKKQRGMGEVYTPTSLANQMLTDLPDSVWLEGKTFVDPECGDGQLLVAVAQRKLELGHTSILATLYGVDIMPDSVNECKERLLGVCGNTSDNRKIVDSNIRCADSLTYDFTFE